MEYHRVINKGLKAASCLMLKDKKKYIFIMFIIEIVTVIINWVILQFGDTWWLAFPSYVQTVGKCN